MTAHWLDIIPAMPLARGVPAIKINGSRKIEFRGVVMGPSGAGWRVRCSRALPPDRDGGEAREGDLFLRGIDGLRVDLADPQGFGYALRYAVSALGLMSSGAGYTARGMTAGSCLVAPRTPGEWAPAESPLHGLLIRWACAETTDADRLALARALAEEESE